MAAQLVRLKKPNRPVGAIVAGLADNTTFAQARDGLRKQGGRHAAYVVQRHVGEQRQLGAELA